MENQEKYIKGFNAGYLIAQERSALAKKLLKGTKTQDNKYGQAVLAGINQYTQDQIREKKKEFKERVKLRVQSKKRDQEFDFNQ
jgi:hypothetical protein